MTDIIKQLRKIRRDQELSQDAVAAAAGLFANHISQMEVGNRTPTLTTLNKWVEALGCELVLKAKS